MRPTVFPCCLSSPDRGGRRTGLDMLAAIGWDGCGLGWCRIVAAAGGTGKVKVPSAAHFRRVADLTCPDPGDTKCVGGWMDG